MVEIFFGIITKQAIRRGTFRSVRDLRSAIRIFIDGWNDRCQPFVWTRDADTILAKAKRPVLHYRGTSGRTRREPLAGGAWPARSARSGACGWRSCHRRRASQAISGLPG